jgi:hypothetical protein
LSYTPIVRVVLNPNLTIKPTGSPPKFWSG